MLGFGLGDYIVLVGLIQIPLSICGSLISASREENKTVNVINVINFIIFCSLFASFIGAALTPMIAIAYLQSNTFNRIVFCVYLMGNLFAHFRFMNKKINGNACMGKCKALKNAWICCVIVYTLLLGFSLIKLNKIIIILAAIFYAIYNSCILAFDYYFKEEPLKEWEEAKYELLPLRRISVGNHREWLQKRDIKLRRQTLLFAAVYQAVFIVFILVAAKRITVLAVFIILMLYSLTLGSLLLRWNRRLKDIESREIDGVYRGRALIETSSPLRVKYRDAEGEFQSRCVEKPQRKKYKQGTLVDIVIENGEIVLAEKNLPE
jgi:lysylphosphatidylglycerol synthetase-like protein (DUF2156 family)